tara:strand:- start:1198 stop:1506 length:309 start_codon:yes stop_codon:yes gene_type:complete
MKYILLSVGIVTAASLIYLKKEKTILNEKLVVTYNKQKQIPVKVTLTKYQLEKMLNMVDEEYGYGGPAAPQDSFTFTSIAKGSEHSEEYNISSTHLARKPIE